MTDPDRAALEHIRRVTEAALAAVTVPSSSGTGGSGLGAALLPVPYVSQLGPGADRYTHDSAAAVGAMLVRAYTSQPATPDEFFGRSGQTTDRPLTFQQIGNILNQFSLPNDIRHGLKLVDLFAALTMSRPVFMAVHQITLRDNGLTGESYDGIHYVLAVGVDVENIYIHDPFRKDNSGQGQPVPTLLLYQAWTQIGKEQNAPTLERAAIIPRTPLRRRLAATTVVNVRNGPGTTYAAVGQINAGEVFEITQIQGDWGKIGDQRWVTISYSRDI
jgi:hypothetical protein